MGNKDIRKPFEDKTLQEIKPGEETPFMTQLRDKIRAEEIEKMKDEKKNPDTKINKPVDKKASTEFAG